MKFEIEQLPDQETVAGKCHEKQGYTTNGLIKITPSNCILPKSYQNILETVRDLPIREDDVFLVTNPKCGLYYCYFQVLI